MPSSSPRLARFRRILDLPRIRLTPRDQETIRHVFQHRFLRSAHLRSLLPGSGQHLLRRLQRLYHHGYLDRPRAQIERYTAGSKAMVYGVGPKGIRFLEDKFGIPRRKVDWTARHRSVTRYFLDHTLAVADIMVALEIACRSDSRFTLVHPRAPHEPPIRWSVTLRHRGTPMTVGVVPDAVFGLRAHGHTEAWFFLEADRATMPVARHTLKQTSFLRKLLAYHETWRQKLPTLKCHRFRVLAVTTTPERAANIREAYDRACLGRAPNLLLVTDVESFLRGQNPIQELLGRLTGPPPAASHETE